MTTAEKSKRSSLFWRIAISAIGMILILMAIGNLLLFFLGDTAEAAVSTRRYGGERQGAVSDKRYTWSVDYTFRANNDKIYAGHLTKLGSATSVSVSRTIYYLPFAPFFNTPEDTAEPNLGQLAMIAAGAFCLVAMNRKAKNIKGRPNRQTLTDYDDSIENNVYMEDTMNKFCKNCGSALSADARFCPACGATLETNPPQPPVWSNQYRPQQNIGWTSRHLDPAVIQRAKKHKKSAWIFTIFLTVAFPVGFALAGNLMDDMPLNEALIIGIGLGLLMLLIGIIRISRMKAGIWEGTVTDKRQKRKMDHSQSDDVVRHKTVYTIIVTEDSGKQHKLNYTDNTALYNYFSIGDRIRCHMSFGTYEKFDKSRDRDIFCNVCGTINDLSQDLCKSCRLPLFK